MKKITAYQATDGTVWPEQDVAVARELELLLNAQSDRSRPSALFLKLVQQRADVVRILSSIPPVDEIDGLGEEE